MEDCGKQIYLRFWIGRSPIIGLVDTGADVSIFDESYLSLYLPDYKKYRIDKEKVDIKTFAGNSVATLGVYELPFRVGTEEFKMPFIVTQARGYTIKVIVGRDLLQRLEASLMFEKRKHPQSGDCENHSYALMLNNQKHNKISLWHIAIPGQFVVKATGNFTIKSRKSAYVEFSLHYNPFIGLNDHICISQSPETSDGLFVYETRCKPEFTYSGSVLGTALVHNFSNKDLEVKQLRGILEILPEEQFKFTELTQANKKAIIQSLTRTGLSSLVLPNTPARQSAKVKKTSNLGAKPKQSKQQYFSAKINTFYGCGMDREIVGKIVKQIPVSKLNQTTGSKQILGVTNTLSCYNVISESEAFQHLPDKVDQSEFAMGLLDEVSGPSLSVPPKTDKKIYELVEVDKYDPRIQKYIQDIFIDKYPVVVGRHNLDAGQLRYLGKVTIRTKPGMTLPKHRRLYALNAKEQSHLTDIIEFLLKFDIIRETFQDSEEHSSSPWGALGHLVSRKTRPGEPNEGQPSLARIVINYRDNLNSIILPTPSLVPAIETCLEKLRTGYLFSSLDLKQSYFGLTLAPDSEGLTQFLVPPGNSYCFKRVPMGLSSAPASLLEKLSVVFNYKPKRDREGKVIFKPGQRPDDVTSQAELEYAPLDGIVNFYDDILVTTEKVENDDKSDTKSLKRHFELLEKVVKRMATFDLRTSFHKCTFGTREVLFLGWLVSDGIVRPDPARLEKVRDFKFPESRKDLQSFLGLINTMRRITPLTAGQYLAPLSSLSSTKEKFVPTELHRKCFEGIKQELTGQNLFCSLMNPVEDKILFTDSSGVAYGSVLLERIPDPSTNELPLQKSHISEKSLDTLDLVIRKWQLKYIRGELTGHKNDSFYESIIAIADQNQLHKVPKNVLDLKLEIVKFLRKDSLGEQVKEIMFKGNRNMFIQYLQHSIQALRVKVTPQCVVPEAVAKLYNRGLLIVYDSLTEDKPRIKEVVGGVSKTCQPIKLGYYEEEERFVPLKDTLDFEFDSKLLNSKFKVCYYDCKLIGKENRNKTILENEATALLIALKKYEPFIKTCRTFIVIDNRSLYYLFSPSITSNHAKINRFQMKLVSDYPSCQILWCNTKENISDLFTRFGLQTEYEQKIKFEDFRITAMPKLPENCVLTWASWADIVDKNPQCIELLVNLDKTYKTKSKGRLESLKSVYDNDNERDERTNINLRDDRRISSLPKVVHALSLDTQPASHAPVSLSPEKSKSKCHKVLPIIASSAKLNPKSVLINHLYAKNMTLLTVPMDCLRDKLSFSAIKDSQKEEFPEIFEAIEGQDHFVQYKALYFKTFEGLLYASSESTGKLKKIYVPKKLEPTVLALMHLRLGHLGAKGLAKEVGKDYRFSSTNFHDMCKAFVNSCFHCFINNNSSRKIALGILSLSDINAPFDAMILDLAEDLNVTQRKHKHMLLVKCLLTSFLMLLPSRTKKSSEIYFILLTYVFPVTGIPKLIISDNGSCFRGTELVTMLTAIRIKLMVSPALKPEARGLIERSVGIVKSSLRKLVSIQSLKTIQIDVLATLVTLYYNNTYNERVKDIPSYLAFGRTTLETSIFSWDSPVMKQHPFLLKSHKLAHQNKLELTQMYEVVKKEIEKVQKTYAQSIRKPITRELPSGTIVYLKKYEKPLGVKTVFYATYAPDAYVVVSSTQTYVVIQRIADGFLTVRSKNDVKQYRNSEILKTLPKEVQEHLSSNFTNLSQQQIDEIAANAQLQLVEDDIPEGSWDELEQYDPNFFVLTDESDSEQLQNADETIDTQNSEDQSDPDEDDKESNEESSEDEDERGKRFLRNRVVYFEDEVKKKK